MVVPGDHIAHEVLRFVDQLDLSAIEAEFSSLGRRGHAPRRVLALWVYASLIGMHHATEVARACATDAAMKLLSGGYAISEGVLKRFRAKHPEMWTAVMQATVTIANREGLIAVEHLATDSMRLRAHAARHQTGTSKRSTERLQQLEAVDVATLSTRERAIYDEKVSRHRAIVDACTKRERKSAVLTNPEAALMKFPDGAAHPGHRITATAAGKRERVIVSVLVDAAPSDDGKLESALRDAQRVLSAAGAVGRLGAVADAGYFCVTDLEFARTNTDWVDVLIAEGSDASKPVVQGRKGYFDRTQFKILDDLTAICPANKPMGKSSVLPANGRLHWYGRGCQTCELRPQCTSAKRRSLTADLNLERARDEMRRKMAAPGARERYAERFATIEPVFSNIEDTMGYRRASSRDPRTLVNEVLLKVIAHNLSRITAARRLACVHVPLDVD